LRFTLPLCALAGYFPVSRQGAKRQSEAQSIFETVFNNFFEVSIGTL